MEEDLGLTGLIMQSNCYPEFNYVTLNFFGRSFVLRLIVFVMCMG